MLEKKFSILSWEIKGSLNLNLTMRSEQYTNSNWKRMNGKYRKIVRLNGNLFGLEVWQEGSVEKPEVYVKVYSKRHVDEKIVEDFRLRILRELGLNYDLDVVYEKLEKDEVARKLVNQFFGLRLVRYTNPEECLLTYQLSTNTTIKRLEQMIENLKQRFCGRFKFSDNTVLWEFPTVKLLAKQNQRKLRECKLGYKAEYLWGLVKALIEKPVDWEKLKIIELEEARKTLTKLPGVGLKVADAVLLYGLGRTETFPIDIWVRRALVKLYGLNPNSTYKQLQDFVKSKFGVFSGYFGPYLFCWGRNQKIKV